MLISSGLQGMCSKRVDKMLCPTKCFDEEFDQLAIILRSLTFSHFSASVISLL